MAGNGRGWPGMAGDGLGWSGMVGDGQGWSGTVGDGTQWALVTSLEPDGLYASDLKRGALAFRDFTLRHN